MQNDGQAKAHPKSSRLDRGPIEASKQHQQLGVNIYASSKQPRPPPGRPQPPVGHAHRSTHSSQKARPIIIVPEGVSALMSLFNTQKLLQVCYMHGWVNVYVYTHIFHSVHPSCAFVKSSHPGSDGSACVLFHHANQGCSMNL